ncbi:MAG TPA: M23 family metallopeptidase [Sphingomicrobium sp.]|jgi:murein DD-endopeptidase MepM/ murein hydrolase activator NlpD|nr:M23 family metallopeptidase [Sphingomicrobium sp.]
MYQSTIVAEGCAPVAWVGPAFGLRAPPRRRLRDYSLAVDLADDLFSARWWRGLLTLSALTTGAALLAPGLEPLAGGRASEKLEPKTAEQMEALGIAPSTAGATTGLRMTETAAVEPLAEAPMRSSITLFATLGQGASLSRTLMRNGVSAGDAIRAEALVRSGGRKLASGTVVSLRLGAATGHVRPVEEVSLRAALDLQLTVRRVAGALVLQSTPIRLDTRPLRLRGRVGSGLYWSLRSAGATPVVAAAYLQALATQIEVGSEIAPDDRFDLILANRRAATGESINGPLLFAGLDRAAARDLQLLSWPVGRGRQWIDAATAGDTPPPSSSAVRWPVQAQITSGFGWRVHPILRFGRMHRGIDFGARWGTPIVAAGDGQVVRAGWSGGYGQQVRIAHGGGLLTSYSHMSRIIVPGGTPVRQGQLIGYVGSTGLSTGPHLHFETLRNGVAVNPAGVRFAASAAPVDPRQAAAIRARLKQLIEAAAG